MHPRSRPPPVRVRAAGASTPRGTARAGLALTTSAGVSFVAVAAFVSDHGGHDRWDVATQRDLLGVGGRGAAAAAVAATGLAAPVVLVGVLLVAVLLLWRGAHRPLLAAGVLAVPVATAALVQLLGAAFAGARPSTPVLLGMPVVAGSFPSAGTADADALWEVLALVALLLVRRAGTQALCVGGGALLGGVVAWGQLYRDRAWPTDVLAGWLLAAAVVGMAATLLATWPGGLSEPPHGAVDPADQGRPGRGRARLTR